MKSEVQTIAEMFSVGNSQRTSLSTDAETSCCCYIPTRGVAARKRNSKFIKLDSDTAFDDIRLSVSEADEELVLTKRKFPRKPKGFNMKNKLQRTFTLCCTNGQNVSMDDDDVDDSYNVEPYEDDHGRSKDDMNLQEDQNLKQERKEPKHCWKILKEFTAHDENTSELTPPPTPTNILQVYAAGENCIPNIVGPVENIAAHLVNNNGYPSWQDWSSESSTSSGCTSSSPADGYSSTDSFSTIFPETSESSAVSSESSLAEHCNGIQTEFGDHLNKSENCLNRLNTNESYKYQESKSFDSFSHHGFDKNIREQRTAFLDNPLSRGSDQLNLRTDVGKVVNGSRKSQSVKSNSDSSPEPETNDDDTDDNSEIYENLAAVHDMIKSGKLTLKLDLTSEPHNDEDTFEMKAGRAPGVPYDDMKSATCTVSSLYNRKLVEFRRSNNPEASPWFTVSSFSGDKLILAQEITPTENENIVNGNNDITTETKGETEQACGGHTSKYNEDETSTSSEGRQGDREEMDTLQNRRKQAQEADINQFLLDEKKLRYEPEHLHIEAKDTKVNGADNIFSCPGRPVSIGAYIRKTGLQSEKGIGTKSSTLKTAAATDRQDSISSSNENSKKPRRAKGGSSKPPESVTDKTSATQSVNRKTLPIVTNTPNLVVSQGLAQADKHRQDPRTQARRVVNANGGFGEINKCFTGNKCAKYVKSSAGALPTTDECTNSNNAGPEFQNRIIKTARRRLNNAKTESYKSTTVQEEPEIIRINPVHYSKVTTSKLPAPPEASKYQIKTHPKFSQSKTPVQAKVATPKPSFQAEVAKSKLQVQARACTPKPSGKTEVAKSKVRDQPKTAISKPSIQPEVSKSKVLPKVGNLKHQAPLEAAKSKVQVQPKIATSNQLILPEVAKSKTQVQQKIASNPAVPQDVSQSKLQTQPKVAQAKPPAQPKVATSKLPVQPEARPSNASVKATVVQTKADVQIEAAKSTTSIQPNPVTSTEKQANAPQLDELKPLHFIDTDVDISTTKVEEAPPVYIETEATVDYGRCVVEPGHGERPDKKKLRAEIKEKIKTKGEANKHLKAEKDNSFQHYEDMLDESFVDEVEDMDVGGNFDNTLEEPEEGARAASPIVINAADQPQIMDDREMNMVPETIKRVGDPYLDDVEQDYKVSSCYMKKKEKRKQKDDRKKEKKSRKSQTILMLA